METEQFAALYALGILDTPPEQRFDKIASFAASEFNVPIAVISLVDETRQWFKSKIGLDICGSARDISICSHSIQSAKPFVICDLSQDSRFRENPFVRSDSHIRFYAGVPLKLRNGQSVGMLCVMDIKARAFDKVDCAILGLLGVLSSTNSNRLSLSRRSALQQASTRYFMNAYSQNLSCFFEPF